MPQWFVYCVQHQEHVATRICAIKIIYAIKRISEHFSKSNIKNLSLLSQTHTCYARRKVKVINFFILIIIGPQKDKKKFKNEKVSFRKS